MSTLSAMAFPYPVLFYRLYLNFKCYLNETGINMEETGKKSLPFFN